MDSGPWSSTAWRDCISACTVEERHQAEGGREGGRHGGREGGRASKHVPEWTHLPGLRQLGGTASGHARSKNDTRQKASAGRGHRYR